MRLQSSSLTFCLRGIPVGELHLEVLLHSLEDDHGVAIVESDPMVSYRETITATSTAAALKKSSNKLNRLWFKASPLAPELVDALASPDSDPNDFKALGKLLVNEYAWDKQSAQRLWVRPRHFPGLVFLSFFHRCGLPGALVSLRDRASSNHALQYGNRYYHS